MNVLYPNKVVISSFVAVLLGVSIMMPFEISVGGAPFFYVQSASIILALMLFLVYGKISYLTTLDYLVAFYAVWVFLSFLINLPFIYIYGGFDLIIRQAASLVYFYFLMAPYLLGRYFFNDGRKIVLFLWLVLMVVFVFSIFLLYLYYEAGAIGDVRKILLQRFPMLFAFMSWVSIAMTFVSAKKYRFICIGLWCVFSIIVALSLTRAAYLQWLVSAMFFIIYFFNRSYFNVRNRFYLITSIFALAMIVMLFLFKNNVSTVTDRAFMIFEFDALTNEDYSANLRLKIWGAILNNLLNNPFHLFFGYGQLGSSFIKYEFVSILNETMSATSAHSQYLDTLVRSGLIGFFLEIYVMLFVIVKSLSIKVNENYALIFKGHGVALIGVMAFSIFNETMRWQIYGFYFWIYSGILSSYLSKNQFILNAYGLRVLRN